MSKPISIIEAGRTFAALAERKGDFADWMATGLGVPQDELQVVAAFAGNSLPSVDDVGAVVVTGSHAMVTERHDWSERLAAWLTRVVADGVPVLGICYGHQLLGHALGGTVGDHPGGGEFGTVEARLLPAVAADPLFADLPAAFPVQVYHRQALLELPRGAQPLAVSQREPHQAVRFAPRVWGVQFHPEFDVEVAASYLALDGAALSRQGEDPVALHAALQQTPVAGSLLRRFAGLFRNGGLGRVACSAGKTTVGLQGLSGDGGIFRQLPEAF